MSHRELVKAASPAVKMSVAYLSPCQTRRQATRGVFQLRDQARKLILPVSQEHLVLLVYLRAQHRMQLHRWRILARGSCAAQRLCHRSHIVRGAAAANANVINSQRLSLARKVCHLKAIMQKWLQGQREGARTVLQLQRLKSWGVTVRLVGHRLGRDIAG